MKGFVGFLVLLVSLGLFHPVGADPIIVMPPSHDSESMPQQVNPTVSYPPSPYGPYPTLPYGYSYFPYPYSVYPYPSNVCAVPFVYPYPPVYPYAVRPLFDPHVHWSNGMLPEDDQGHVLPWFHP